MDEYSPMSMYKLNIFLGVIPLDPHSRGGKWEGREGRD